MTPELYDEIFAMGRIAGRLDMLEERIEALYIQVVGKKPVIESTAIVVESEDDTEDDITAYLSGTQSFIAEKKAQA